MLRCYPPDDFVCKYRNACPHLDELSTTWVLGEYRRSEDIYQEQLQIIDRFYADLSEKEKRIRILERENTELKAKLQALHQRQFKTNKKKAAGNNAGEDAVPAAPKKKRGAPVGHPYWERPQPDHIDRTVVVPAPVVCPHCQSTDVTPLEETTEHIQEDIVIQPRIVVTQYVHGKSFCAHCHRIVIQAGEDELLNAPIGPVTKSLAIYLRYRIGISYRKVTQLFQDVFGLKFVPASAVGFDRQAAARGAPLYEDVREKIRNSAVVHGDETSWRNDGRGHFVWFAGNEQLAFFQIDRHRSAAVAQSIFGDKFDGTLVRDRYAAYNGIGKDCQLCLAHIITNAKAVTREHALLPETDQDAAAATFCDGVITLCSELCASARKLKSGDLPWETAAAIQRRSVRKLNKLCNHSLRFKPAENLRTALAGPEQKSFFTFLRRPGVPPTNNLAEQTLRFMVILRKIVFGTRSERGLKTHSILPTLVQTARKQGIHPRHFLQLLLTVDTKTAQAALYNNSS